MPVDEIEAEEAQWVARAIFRHLPPFPFETNHNNRPTRPQNEENTGIGASDRNHLNAKM